MKQRLLYIGIILLFIFSFHGDNVFAAGELDVTYLGGPLPSPVFNVTNMAPGDSESHAIDVENISSIPQLVSVKGVRTGGAGLPALEGILDIVIVEGVTPLYGTGSPTGPKTVQDFFSDSSAENGVILELLNPSQTKTYTFIVAFPASSGNEYQNTSVIFDLIFGAVLSDHVVINEVFYDVDENHGFDSPKDRGIISIHGNNAVVISGNGAGSVNAVTIDIKKTCKLVQQNHADIRNFVDVANNTGGNSAGNNTATTTTVTSGNASVFISILNLMNSNFSSSFCNGSKLGQNHEWIELYNPTDQTISLKNWSFVDNSGEVTTIHANKKIKPHSFALVTKDSATWRFWHEPSTLKINLGRSIGDGLDDDGDHIVLYNSSGALVDFVAWGNDTFDWNPAVPDVPEGSSIERLSAGFDADLPTDWDEQAPPTPGE
ncbi:lamin tail domain-containing protein [Candidatus Roizmanbacteria bacterium]|nr:lamin tail domain-containing protein [Candidatus Roizmanbacteria bacterium]